MDIPRCYECEYWSFDNFDCRLDASWAHGGSCQEYEPKKKATSPEPPEDKPMDIIKEIGLPAALEQLAEECCELGQAALKLARKLRGENPTPKSEVECRNALREEMADVLVCMEALSLAGATTKEAVDEIADEKRKRWIGRLSEDKEKK